MSIVEHRMVMGRIAGAVAVVGLLAACGGDDADDVDTTTTASESTTTAEGASDLPGTVTISAWADSSHPATGEATVSEEGDDVTLSIEATTDNLPPGYAALIVAGTCEEQPEPPDFEAALDTDTVTDTAETGEVTASSADLTEGPHALLLTTPSGEHNLGCGQITD